MPIVACLGCTRPLKFEEVPSDKPLICDSCLALIATRNPPTAETVPPDIPTPRALRTLRIPDPSAPAKQVDNYGGLNTSKVVVVMAIGVAVVSLLLWLTWR